MAIQNFFTSRDNNLDGNTYVGQLGRLWYNPDTNSLYASDGVTVGGVPVDLATGANITANIITVATLTSTTGEITVTGDLDISGNISPAANGKIGGITPGPGVDISNTGLLTIDTANLPLSFGDFTANTNILTIVNVDEDMILATQGDAEIQLVGNIGFFKSNGLPPNPSNRFFFAKDDGKIQIFVPDADPVTGAVEIIGSATSDSITPAQVGVMLHITGQPNIFASQYIDGINNFPNYIGRRYNGNVTSPTQVRAGNTIVRFSGQGYSTGGFNAPADGTISLDALEDFTESNQGVIWRFLLNPVGGNIRQEVANVSVANGVTATKFTTSGAVSATGNITGGNVLTGGTVSATGNISAGNLISTSAEVDYLAVGVSIFNKSDTAQDGVVITTTGGAKNTIELIPNGANSTIKLTADVITATGNVTAGNVLSAGTITSNSATAGIGYRTGAGTVVTQETSKSTPVTINAVTGEITMNAAQLSGDSTVSFVMTNSAIANTDVIILNQVSDANIGVYSFNGQCNSGNARISVHNMTNTNRSDAIVIRFAVIRGAVA